MRKLMYGALALGAAAAVSFGAGAVDASAAEMDVSVTGDTLKLTPGNNEKVILVGEAKVQKKEYLKVSSWDVYESDGNNGPVSVDISKLSKTKDHFIQVKADYSEDILATIKIAASDKLTAKYDKTKAEITVQNNKAAVTSDTLDFSTESGSKGKLVIAAGKGSVVDVDEDGNAGSTDLLPMYQASGGTLYIRSAASSEASDTLKAGDFTLKKEGDNAGNWEGKTFKRASKDVKLTIGKLANAPKVKANYVKGEVTVPKNVDFRISSAEEDDVVDGDDANANDTYKAFKNTDKTGTASYPDATVLSVGTGKGLLTATAGKFAIDLYTPKTDKKLASKTGHFVFNKQDETKIKEDTTNYITGKLVTAGKSTTLELTNTTTAAAPIEYTVSYTKEGVTSASTAKLASGKTAKLVKIDLKKEISIQTAGNAKESTWPGTVLKYFAYKKDAPSGTDDEKCLDKVVSVSDNRTKEKYTFNIKIDIPTGVTIKAGTSTLKKGENTVEEGAEIVFSVTADAVNSGPLTLGTASVKDDNNIDIIKWAKKDSDDITYIMPSKNVDFE